MASDLTYQGEGTLLPGAPLPGPSSAWIPSGTQGDSTTLLGNKVFFNLLKDVNATTDIVSVLAVFTPPANFDTEQRLTFTPKFTDVNRGPHSADIQMTIYDPQKPSKPSNVSTPSSITSFSGDQVSSSTMSSIPVSSTISSSSRLITTSTPAPNSTTSVASNSSASASAGINTSAKAGIAVAAVLIVIAMVLGLLFLRRRKRSQARAYSTKSNNHNRAVEGDSFVLAPGSKAAWQKTLPQPESDLSITRLANRTLDEIELFVETFYTDQPAKFPNEAAVSDIQIFNSPYLAQPLASTILSSRSPTVLIKHSLAYHLLLKIDPTNHGSEGLLPREFIVPTQGDQQTMSQQRVHIAQALDLDRDEPYLAHRDEITQTTIQRIENAFRPWARGTSQERGRSLKGILAHLSDLGIKFFSQPATFEWTWNGERKVASGQLVMLPGLDKMTDSQAVSLEKPIRLVDPRLGKFNE